jgi:hypothetical protein
MTGSGNFNGPAAGALVIGGVAAMLLATIVTLGGYGRPGGRVTSVGASGAAPNLPGAGGALPETDVEYLLDTSEPTATPERGTP